MNNYQISAMQDYEIEKQKPLPDVDSDDPDYQEKLQQKYEEDDLKQTQDMRQDMNYLKKELEIMRKDFF